MKQVINGQWCWEQVHFSPASITGAGAFDTENSALLNAKCGWMGSVLKEIYEKAEKGKIQRFLRGKCSVTGGTAAEVKNKSFSLYTMYSRINMNFYLKTT